MLPPVQEPKPKQPLTPIAPMVGQNGPGVATPPRRNEADVQPSESPAPHSSLVHTQSGRLLRVFEIDKVEILKLSHINVASSTFKAQVWLQFRVEGAASDEDFCRDGVVFPTGPNGKPTFRPSALWYVEKLEFANAEGAIKLVDKLVRCEGDDVLIACRWEGVFFERYELYDFPFDLQALTMSLSINCRTTGPIPASFACSSDSGTTVSSDEQLLGDAWSLKMRTAMLRTQTIWPDFER